MWYYILLWNKKPHFAWRVWVNGKQRRKFLNSISIITHGFNSMWGSFIGEMMVEINGIKAVIAQTNSHLYKQSLTALMSFNATLISHSKEPHLEFFTHNLHSLIPFMRSEALTFMVGRYISPPLLVSPLSCMVTFNPPCGEGGKWPYENQKDYIFRSTCRSHCIRVVRQL